MWMKPPLPSSPTDLKDHGTPDYAIGFRPAASHQSQVQAPPTDPEQNSLKWASGSCLLFRGRNGCARRNPLLVEAIDQVNVLDPACGSGAFPMGVLHKLVYVLGRLDPDNQLWQGVQLQKALSETEDAYRIGNQEERKQRILDIEEAFDNNISDYGRKLYLIESCLYGVDIQPIAVQIAKLRFSFPV